MTTSAWRRGRVASMVTLLIGWLALPAAAGGSDASPTPPTGDARSDPLMPGPGQRFAPDERAVLETHAAWGRAEARHDRAAIEAILDPKFYATVAVNGKVLMFDRKSFIDMAVNAIELNGRHEYADQRVIVDGDTAGSMLTEVIHSTKDGAETQEAYRITTTFVRRHGSWIALFEEIAAINPPTAP